MANKKHLEVLRAGFTAWKEWREAQSSKQNIIVPDLSNARLVGMDLRGYDLSHVNLRNAKLMNAKPSRADLWGAHLNDAKLMRATLEHTELHFAILNGANLSHSNIRFATLSRAHLIGATLRNADLRGASLRRAKLQGADLRGAILRHASLAEAEVEGAKFNGAEVYGAGVWKLKGTPKMQKGLIIQDKKTSPPLEVDDLDTAQFLFLLLDNPKIANVIETASKHIVLILGRFTPARKRILEKIKELVLERGFAPVLFDFPPPEGRDLTETIASLAHMSLFIIADITNPKSIPQELSYIVPYLPSVPIVPLIQESDRSYAMFEHFARYKWVQPPVKYKDETHLLTIFDDKVMQVGYREAMCCRGIQNARLPNSLMKRVTGQSGS